jgi:large subunit ribosomal protein L4
MPVVDVVNLEGHKVGQLDLLDAVFGVKVNQHLLHEASRWYLRGLRRGTHKTKDKSEVSGAGRKLWKQKGTGRARVGSIRSPLWRHGGTVHGPRPRDYSYALPKKMLLGALRSALSAKLTEQRLTVVEDWELENHKTKGLIGVLGKLKHKKSALIVAHGENTNLERASRNIAGVTLVAPNGLQPYDLLKHDLLVLSREAVERLSHSLDPEKTSPAAPGAETHDVVTPDVKTIAPAPRVAKKASTKPAAKKAAKKPAKSAKKKGKE